MCLQAESIDDYGSVGIVRRSKGISDNDRGVVRGQGIRDASEGLETTTEASGAIQQARGIYDLVGGVEGGR